MAGLTVKPATARRIMELLNRTKATGNLSVDPVFQSMDGDIPPWEWITYVKGTTIYAAGGQVKYAGVLYPSSEPTDHYEVPFTVSEGASAYVIVKLTIPTGAVDVELSATRPVDSPSDSIVRVALSKWTMTNGVPVLTRILHRGAIQLSGIYVP
jgi:hypothetical protein